MIRIVLKQMSDGKWRWAASSGEGILEKSGGGIYNPTAVEESDTPEGAFSHARQWLVKEGIMS